MRKVESLQWTALEAANNKTDPSVKHFQPSSQGSVYIRIRILISHLIIQVKARHMHAEPFVLGFHNLVKVILNGGLQLSSTSSRQIFDHNFQYFL